MTAARNRPTVTIEARALDVDAAATVYGLSAETLRSLCRSHGFPHVRIGRRTVIPVAQADAWFAARADGVPIEVAS